MKIFKCKTCSKIHIEAGNVFIHFPSVVQLKFFSDYIESLNAHHYAAINRSKGLTKDIFLPIGDTSVHMAFSMGEFEELKKVIRDFWAETETGCSTASDAMRLNFDFKLLKYEYTH
ncbi:MAG: hypothetical protein LBS55_11055 [Prevotellaceae bacterium]|jgi:hypothetical protein|nr:hypothetical protein [Prevotellaceae bacterium]